MALVVTLIEVILLPTNSVFAKFAVFAYSVLIAALVRTFNFAELGTPSIVRFVFAKKVASLPSVRLLAQQLNFE